MIWEILFWLSAFAIPYTYIGYPVLLWIVTRLYDNTSEQKPITPKLTLLISCYNEEQVIENKIRNSLELAYPQDKKEIIVISDASSDKTDEIVRKYHNKGAKLARFEGRIGKTACLNKIMPETNGEIIIFSDANSIYPENVLEKIVSYFADNQVGCVTGYTKYLQVEKDRLTESVGLYAKIEKWTKFFESKLGSCVGADGAIFAIRKSLFRPLKEYDINDFAIPLRVISQGYRVVLGENIFCWEKSADDLSGEMNRQVRITNRTIRALWNNRTLFNIIRYPLFSIQLISHKLFKFFSPLFLATLLLSNIMVSGHSPFYVFTLSMQCIFYIFIALPATIVNGKYLQKLHEAGKTFFGVNAAIAKGWLTFFKGENYITWKSSR